MKAYWLIGIVMAAGLRAQPQDCGVDVYLVIAAPIPDGMLLDARLKATAMFREIGVNVRMRMGIPPRDPIQACGSPIVVKFENAAGYPAATNALASATPYKESGACIHVFIDRVRLQLGRELPAFSNALLAHVMVHEITHVLEKIARHSGEGVMKAVWSSQDYERMKRHSLPFAPEDVDLIRDGLAGRISHATAE
jgi:hypothetical protein